MEKPHCARCDDVDCTDVPGRLCEKSFIEAAGEKPRSGILRSSWEHDYLVWCRAWKTLLRKYRDGM